MGNDQNYLIVIHDYISDNIYKGQNNIYCLSYYAEYLIINNVTIVQIIENTALPIRKKE